MFLLHVCSLMIRAEWKRQKGMLWSIKQKLKTELNCSGICLNMNGELSFQILSQSFFNLIFKVNVNVDDFISDELIEYIYDRCDKRNENSIPCSIDKITKGKACLDFGVHSLTSQCFSNWRPS